ncbi:MAG: response regulator [Proteobacteria bacterium]|nr:response regulator [Pseudomonadota bacterium]
MRSPPLILVVDDNASNRDILETRLRAHGYEVCSAADGEEGLAAARERRPDLILLDIMMPKIDGVEVCRRLKADATLPFMPIIMITAKSDSKDIVAALDAGGDEYLTKPIDQAALIARVKSILRVKALHDKTEEQAAQLGEWNRTLEARVAGQIKELEKVGELRRFLAPQVADAILTAGNERILESHRRDITVLFCDLRGFTAFTETAEPEEVMAVLRDFHTAMGGLIHEFEGTLDRFVGDGLMVLFNDPLPCPEPAARAVRLAVAMRERVRALSSDWRRQGHQLDFGVGVAQGYATLGRIGFEGRFDYSAIGTVPNLASRLCDEAKGGQILISQRVHAAVEEVIEGEPIGELPLKGFLRPVAAYNVRGLKG